MEATLAYPRPRCASLRCSLAIIVIVCLASLVVGCGISRIVTYTASVDAQALHKV